MSLVACRDASKVLPTEEFAYRLTGTEKICELRIAPMNCARAVFRGVAEKFSPMPDELASMRY